MVIPTCQGDTASSGGAKVAEAVPCFCTLMEKLLRRSLWPTSPPPSFFFFFFFLSMPHRMFYSWVSQSWSKHDYCAIRFVILGGNINRANTAAVWHFLAGGRKKKLHKYNQVAAALPLNLCTCKQLRGIGGDSPQRVGPAVVAVVHLVVKWRPWLLFFFCLR